MALENVFYDPVTGSTTSAAGGGGAPVFPVVPTNPVSPAVGDSWIVATEFTEPSSVTSDGSFWNISSVQAMSFAISPYDAGDFLALFGEACASKSFIAVATSVDDGVSVRGTLATDSNGGLFVTQNPGVSTIAQVVTAINNFSQSLIGKDVVAVENGLGGSFVSDLDFAPNSLTVPGLVAESAALRVKNTHAIFSVTMS